MSATTVKDIMIPISECVVVHEKSHLEDAILQLDSSRVTPAKLPLRAVLVKNNAGEIIGKVGHLAFLKGLEPKYRSFGDLGLLSRSGVSDDIIDSIQDNFALFDDTLPDICKRAQHVLIQEVMHPITECIGADASISEALHKIIMWNQISLLVTHDGDIIGWLRLGDLFEEIRKNLIEMRTVSSGGQNA